MGAVSHHNLGDIPPMARNREEFDDRHLSRILGCSTGVAVGDAFGMPMAGWTPTEIRRRNGKVSGLMTPVPDHRERDVATLGNAIGAIKAR